MKNISRLLAVFILFLMMGTSLSARTPKQVLPKEIVIAYDGLSRIILRKDTPGLQKYWKRYVMPSFIHINDRGKRETSQQKLSAEISFLNAMEVVHSMRFHITQYSVRGRVAVLTTRGVLSATVPDPQGRSRLMDATVTATDTWEKTKTGWKIKKSQYRGVKMMIDGQVVQPL